MAEEECFLAVLGGECERFVVDHLRIERCAVGGGRGIERIRGQEGIDVVAVGRAFENFADAAVARAEGSESQLIPLKVIRNIRLQADFGERLIENILK